jgi:2-oxo-3-hexenedioate decarboxylase
VSERRPSAEEIAVALDDATRDRRPMERFTAADPDLSPVLAYRAQAHGVQLRLAAGESIIGAKLGLTSRAKQRAMRVDEPLYGWLTSSMLFEPGNVVAMERLIHPRIEPEIGFLTSHELSAPATVPSVLAATAGVMAALEVIDSRYENFDFQLPDVIADNASAAGLVLGPVLRPVTALEDLRLLGCILRHNGAIVDTASGAAVMGHPAAAIAWLVNRLGADGRSLPAGSIVLSGGLTNALPIGHGDVVSVEIDGLGTAEAVA